MNAQLRERIRQAVAEAKPRGPAAVVDAVVACAQPERTFAEDASLSPSQVASAAVERWKGFRSQPGAPLPHHQLPHEERGQWIDHLHDIQPLRDMDTSPEDVHSLAAVVAGRLPSAVVSREFAASHPVGQELLRRARRDGHAHVFTATPWGRQVAIIGSPERIAQGRYAVETGDRVGMRRAEGYPDDVLERHESQRRPPAGARVGWSGRPIANEPVPPKKAVFPPLPPEPRSAAPAGNEHAGLTLAQKQAIINRGSRPVPTDEPTREEMHDAILADKGMQRLGLEREQLAQMPEHIVRQLYAGVTGKPQSAPPSPPPPPPPATPPVVPDPPTGRNAAQQRVLGRHQGVLDDHAGWIDQQSQRFQRLGIDPSHARGQIQEAMRRLLTQGGGEAQIVLRGADGRTHRATLRRKPRPGSTFSEAGASAAPEFDLDTEPVYDQIPEHVQSHLRWLVMAWSKALDRGDRQTAAGLLEEATWARAEAVHTFCELPR